MGLIEMRTETKLVVNVVQLLENPGSRKDLSFSEAVEGLDIELARVGPDEKLRFDLSLESIEDGILVRGPVSGGYVETCRRCLRETPRVFGFEAAEVYRPPRDTWEEGYVIEGETIDLRPLVRDNVLINLPMYPLCREDCAGLCTRCGANLNEGPCGCPAEEGDLRWSALRDLLPGRGEDG